jgi:hypothetical protein
MISMTPSRLASGLFFGVLVPAIASTVQAAPPAPLAAALDLGVGDSDSWAYTQTSRDTDSKGIPGAETVFRFDPSKPYAEQFTPIKIDGEPPTAKQIAAARERGVKRGERLDRQANAPQPAPSNDPETIDINGAVAVVDFDRATLAQDDGAHLTYTVPLRPGRPDQHSLPADKLLLSVTISKDRPAFEHASIRLLEPFRPTIVAKVFEGRLSADFARIDPQSAPVVVGVNGDVSLSVVFVHFHGGMGWTRADFQRVTPYRQRFGVKLGPLKTLSF